MNDKIVFNLREAFASLKRANAKYCVISDYTALPEAPSFYSNAPLEILAENPDDVVGLMALHRKGFPEQYALPSNPNLVIQVYKKGNGVMPDSFEASLLSRTTLHNDIVKVPAFEEHTLMCLFRSLFHWNGYKETPWLRKVLVEYVKRKTGTPRRTKYKSLAWTP